MREAEVAHSLHVPAMQAGMPFGGAMQAFMQPPQFMGSVATFASQPSATILLQSANPMLHDAMAHVPFTHEGVPFGAAHGWLHAPQLFTSLDVATEHPEANNPSQFEKPASQEAIAHLPAMHAPVPFNTVAQEVPQAPQLAMSESRAASHPFAAILSQSAKPGSQEAITHVIIGPQAPVACGRAAMHCALLMHVIAARSAGTRVRTAPWMVTWALKAFLGEIWK